MADEAGEEDAWLYGENVTEDQIKIDPDVANKLLEDENEEDGKGTKKDVDDSAEAEGEGDGTPNEEAEKDDEEGPNDEQATDEEDVDDEEDDDDSDDDGVQVVIGDLKSGQSSGSFGAAKRSGGPPPDKKGKFSTEDFEAPGTINGVSALEYNVDSLEDKPWRKPGADITDYFNYGFTEDTWRAYCERQKRLRVESGAGLPNPMARDGDAVKFSTQSNIMFPKKFGQQQYQRKDGSTGPIKQEPQENTIQVRVVNTADRRDNFARKGYEMPGPMVPPPFDLSVPPPPFMGQPPPDFFNRPPPGFYHEQEMPGYEEQQWMDSQWEMGGIGTGASSSISVVPLTKVPIIPPPPGEADTPSTSKDGQ